jgi:CYTH domain-containing protein/CHAD domain-containing protein
VAEIERKFLVEEMPRAESAAARIEQGYLALDDHGEVRLRRIDGELLLAAKGGHGQVREEVELPIDPSAFEALWPLTAGRRVRKVRHYVPLGEGLRAEVDVYEGALDGLRTAEIEFDSREQADRFLPPAWLGAELTGDGRYANQTLATKGLPKGADGDHARAFRLRADEDAAAGVRRAIVGRLEKAAARLREADEGDALAESIHGARKDLKKARAALRLVRAELGGKTFKRENRALRDAGRTLSASRDAEVKLATLDALAAGDGDVSPAAALRWREALLAERERIVAGESGDVAAAVAAIEAVAARAPEWQLGAGGWKLLAPGLDTAYREGREAFAALGHAPDFEAVHELRKRGKDLWYQLRLLGDAWRPVLEPTAEAVNDFTDLLGDHHDLAVLAVDLAGRAEVDDADREALRGLIEERQASLLAEARSAGERIYAEKPKAFARRMRAYWHAWRQEP